MYVCVYNPVYVCMCVSIYSCIFQLIQYQKQSNLAFVLLVKPQMQEEPVNIPELMSYRLSLVPHCLVTPDGFFSKTNIACTMS